jgi:uncharacterized membrane protein
LTEVEKLGASRLIFAILLTVGIVLGSKDAFTTLTGNGTAYLLYIGAVLILSSKNIPLYKNKERDVIMLNAGGALLPTCLALLMMGALLIEMDYHGWMYSVAVILLLSVAAAYATSRYIPGVGVVSKCLTLPLLVALITNAVILAMTYYGNMSFTAPVLHAKMMMGFVASTLGALIGCDILKLPQIGSDGRYGDNVGMGGAGVFDGVFISGIMTMKLILMVG